MRYNYIFFLVVIFFIDLAKCVLNMYVYIFLHPYTYVCFSTTCPYVLCALWSLLYFPLLFPWTWVLLLQCRLVADDFICTQYFFFLLTDFFSFVFCSFFYYGAFFVFWYIWARTHRQLVTNVSIFLYWTSNAYIHIRIL